MLRINVPERPQWKTLAKELGFHFHTIDGEPYWKENAYYQFTLEQRDALFDVWIQYATEPIFPWKVRSCCLKLPGHKRWWPKPTR